MLDFAIKCKHPIYKLDALYEAYEKDFVEIIDLINNESTNVTNRDLFCKLNFPYEKFTSLVRSKLNPDDYFLVAYCDLETKINAFIRKFNPNVPWISTYYVTRFFYSMIAEKIKNTLAFFDDGEFYDKYTIGYTRVKHELCQISNINSNKQKNIGFECGTFLDTDSEQGQQILCNWLIGVNICPMLNHTPIRTIFGIKSCEGDSKKLLNSLFVYLSASHAPMLNFDVIYDVVLGVSWNDISLNVIKFLNNDKKFNFDPNHRSMYLEGRLIPKIFRISGALSIIIDACFPYARINMFDTRNWIIHLISEKTKKIIICDTEIFYPSGEITGAQPKPLM